VVEPDRQQALSGHVLDTTVSAAGPHMLIQICDRFGQPGVMGGQHRPAGGRIPEAVEDRDALGRPQDHIEGGDGVAAVRAAKELASGGVAAFEHGLEPGHRCFALQPQAAGAGAVPAAWGLAVARQILFVVGGQFTGVVLLAAYRELGNVGHHPAAALPPSLARATHPWCIALLGKDCGPRVVRNGDGHPLWQAQLQTTGVGADLGGAAGGSWYGVGWAQ
jgi:hypothetical protein